MSGIFRAVPRGELVAALADQAEYRHFAERLLARCKQNCPVSVEEDDGGGGSHLRDTLVLRYISGPDPRIMVGSVEKGAVLGYVIHGTEAHPIDPVNASVLRFTSGGTVVFAAHVEHPGTKANDFVLRSVQQLLHDT